MNTPLIKNKTLIKTLIFRSSFIIVNILTARLWFGDWHVTQYQIVMIISMSIMYYLFERDWVNNIGYPGNNLDWLYSYLNVIVSTMLNAFILLVVIYTIQLYLTQKGMLNV